MKNNARRKKYTRLVQAKQVRVEVGDVMGRRRMDRFVDHVGFFMKQQRERVSEVEKKETR